MSTPFCRCHVYVFRSSIWCRLETSTYLLRIASLSHAYDVGNVRATFPVRVNRRAIECVWGRKRPYTLWQARQTRSIMWVKYIDWFTTRTSRKNITRKINKYCKLLLLLLCSVQTKSLTKLNRLQFIRMLDIIIMHTNYDINLESKTVATRNQYFITF